LTFSRAIAGLSAGILGRQDGFVDDGAGCLPLRPDLDAAERGGQPERDGAADARPAPVISAVLPVKSVATAVSFICRVTGNAGEAPPSVRENKGHIPNGRRLTASARRILSDATTAFIYRKPGLRMIAVPSDGPGSCAGRLHR